MINIYKFYELFTCKNICQYQYFIDIWSLNININIDIVILGTVDTLTKKQLHKCQNKGRCSNELLTSS